MNSILKTVDLSHKYSGNWAIRDINIEIAAAGVTGLVGSNGAGKSTTMNIICGILKHTEGKVFINGYDIATQPEHAKKLLGFLPQTPPLYNDLTIDEYLHYCAELRLMERKKIKAAVEEAKERCGLSHLSSRLIANLSGGYRQRVGIAQAIIHKPKLVILDEPTNGLDPNQLLQARKLIREIAQDHAVLLSSHILSEIHILCKDIVMIEGGRVVFADTMDAFDNYAQPHSLIISLENPPPTEELLKIEGVNKVELMNQKESRIYFNGDEQVAESLVEAAVRHNWQLRGINLEKRQLDEIFKQLSNPQSR